MKINVTFLALGLLSLGMSAHASGPEVVGVSIGAQAIDGRRSFAVTLKHDDTGWEHYAERFEVSSLKGDVLGVRILGHPHVEEQPFTRSLQGVKVPDSVQKLLVRGRDNKGEYGPFVEIMMPSDKAAHKLQINKK